MQIDQAKIRRESLRWLILLTLNNARPVGAYEMPILAVAQSEYPDATPLEIRRELDYLGDRDLVKLTKEPSGRWFATSPATAPISPSTPLTASRALLAPPSIGDRHGAQIER